MSTHTGAPPRDGRAAIRNDLRSLEKVRGIFASLAKFIGAQAIYQSNNPNLINFARLFEQSFRNYFENETELLLTVSQYQLIWREQVVYDIGCNTESIAFLLYKDGIGELTIQRAVETAELEHLTSILKTALYSPSTQFDIATALWQAEFANISYRVLDEQTDVGESTGDGAGTSQREQPLRADDHLDISTSQLQSRGARASDASLETLGAYYNALAGNATPGGTPRQKEQALQNLLAEHLQISESDLRQWSAGRTGRDADELLSFLRVVLDFTRVRNTPPVARDITDTIERLAHYIRDEGRVGTLMATLELVAGLGTNSPEPAFAVLSPRIEAELTDTEYLVSLAMGSREGNTPDDLLRYLGTVGAKAVPALWALLARSSDDAVHEKGCEIIFAMDGVDLVEATATLNVDSPRLARDVVHLLKRSPGTTVAPIIHHILSSQDPQVRRFSADYLGRVGTDEAARLLCTLFKDDNVAVRMRAWAAAEGSRNSLLGEEVAAQCFSEAALQKSAEELEHMFRALGKRGGVAVLPRLRSLVDRKHYFTVQKSRIKREKLLVITALRYIPGAEARGILERLSSDSDALVKTKAAHVLKQLNQPDPDEDESAEDHS
jgi:hypothetical protein